MVNSKESLQTIVLMKFDLSILRRLIFISITFLFVTNGFAQNTAVNLFHEAEELHFNEEYSAALAKIQVCESKLGKSNAVIEHLKVKCHFELEEFDKAEKALINFFKYKAAEHLVDEMKDYTKKIHLAKINAIKESFYLEQENIAVNTNAVEKAYTEEQNRIKEQTLQKKKALIKVRSQIKYAPLVKEYRNAIEKDLNVLSALKDGKVYYFDLFGKITKWTNENTFIVVYGDKYILFKIPDNSILKKMNKETISFSSSDARKLSELGVGLIDNRKINTYNGSKELTFAFVDSDNSLFVGGNGDELIERTEYINYHDTYSLNYIFDGDYIWPSVGNFLFNLEGYSNAKSTMGHPIIETGIFKKELDYNLLRAPELITAVSENEVSNVLLSDINKPKGVVSILESNGHRSVVSVQKRITYKEASKCCQSLKLTEGESSMRRDGYQYFTPLSTERRYVFLQVNDYYKTVDNFNLVSWFKETDKEVLISEKDFNYLYKVFSKDHGNGAFRRFTEDNTLVYDVLMSISGLKPIEMLGKKIQYVDEEFGTFSEFNEQITIELEDFSFGWGSYASYNSLAWEIYGKSESTQDIKLAIRLIEKSISMKRVFYNLDTYAHLLFKNGESKKAKEIIDQAIELGKKKGLDISVSNQLRERILKKLN